MYFYCLSEKVGIGNNSEYIIQHENKFSNKEFINMYNSIINNLTDRERNFKMSIVARKFCEIYGFENVLAEMEINIDFNDELIMIPEKYINEDKLYFQYDGFDCYYR